MTLSQHVLTAASKFDERIQTRDATVAVIGLGYVGLPLAMTYCQAGFHVVGVDTNEQKAEAVNSGISPIQDIRGDELAAAVASGRLAAQTDYRILQDTDVIFICVPTPYTRNREPDTSCILAAARGIAAHLGRDSLIILRSTSYPGTTHELVRPLLESAGRRVGRDVYLAFAPERIDPGRRDFTIRNTPVLVGGCDPESTRRASLVLHAVTDRVVPMSSPAAAEMSKLLENIFRNVNIALVNQLAMLCERMGLDVWEIIDGAATKPYGFLPFRPGPGVGGHCIPVDPYYLAWKAREYDFHMDFVELAARVNDEMPYYVTTRVLLNLNGGPHVTPPRVLALGVAFKADVDDYRDSPAVKIIELLLRQGVAVDYHDPHIPSLPLPDRTLHSLDLTPDVLGAYDCVLILTDHSAIDYERVAAHAVKVFDTRNATARVRTDRDKIVRL